MRAALRFVHGLERDDLLSGVTSIRVEMFGSLGHTGRGHGTDRAVMLGLMGEEPETVDPDGVSARVEAVERARQIRLGGPGPDAITIGFEPRRDLVFHKRKNLPEHPNGMRFTAKGCDDAALRERIYYSVGGGFVVDEAAVSVDRIVVDSTTLTHPFVTGRELLDQCTTHGLSISTVMALNETAWRSRTDVRSGLLTIAKHMRECIARGCEREGILPGGLKVRRRAAALHRRLNAETTNDALRILDHVNLFALAVNEENAAGGRVVTAPTNGAAGIIPAVLEYYRRYCSNSDDDGVIRFLLAAGAIAIIFKVGASISGA
ncbi:MAG: L-serine dehydratase, partial [Myxococcota bacterium]